MFDGAITTFLVVVIFGTYAVVSSGLLADIGNPLARLLGLQDPPRPHTKANKIAKVIDITDGKIRVEYQGSTWFACSTAEVGFEVGDKVIVVGRDGLTLLVERNSV